MLTKKQQDAIDAYVEHGSQAKAAKALGIKRRTFRDRYSAAMNKMTGAPVGFKTTKISTDKDGMPTAMTHKLAPEMTNEARTGKVIRRSTLYGADGNVTGEWVIRQPEGEVASDDYMEALTKNFSETVTREEPKSPPVHDNSTEDLAMFMSIDEHIGVHLAAEQVGQDYNLDTSLALMEEKFEQLVRRTPKTETCLYVNLGDQFHANDHMDVTPKSKHPMNSDTTFNTVSDAVIALNRRRIALLMDHFDRVDLRGVAGNHDVDPMGWLFRCYDIAYENEDRVTSEFWSTEVGMYEFGNTFLGFNHGDKIKPDALAGVCADRYPQAYGRTNHRYLHTGHVHHDSAKDVWGGFKWESHRTMAPKDHFSYGHGYLSRQSMKSFVYNTGEGEVARMTTSLT